ncbi:MAG: glycosyltransferase family 2 protein [Myxococcota bacterium]
MSETTTPDVVVMVPCHNEELTIGKVIDDFKRELPHARIVVVDNCCTDDTAAIAQAHGAKVIREPRKGKGNAVAAMFEQVRADYYVMVDGDDTYSAASVHDLLEPVMSGHADMVIGVRRSEDTAKSYRRFHLFGNRLVRGLVNVIFGAQLTDIMSGYRAYNQDVVRRIPIVSVGFEIETEMTIQMLYYRQKLVEVPTPYGSRPEGSFSKLSTFRDGFRVLWKIFSLFRAYKPLTFFGGIGLVLFVLGIVAGIPPLSDYFTGPSRYIHHVPLAILATGLVVLSATSTFLGVLLHAINWRFKELHSLVTR